MFHNRLLKLIRWNSFITVPAFIICAINMLIRIFAYQHNNGKYQYINTIISDLHFFLVFFLHLVLFKYRTIFNTIL